jgi:formamidopyrimidine-DNA glycosylase
MTQGSAGIDPLSDLFTLDAFESMIERHADMPLRSFMLDHDVFTRMSAENADRILESAQLAPDRPIGALTSPETHRFHRAIRDTLGRALEGHHGYED